MLVEIDHRVVLVDLDERARARRSAARRDRLWTSSSSLPSRLTASAAAAATAIAAVAAAAAAEPAFGLGPRFVDRQRAAAHLSTG